MAKLSYFWVCLPFIVCAYPSGFVLLLTFQHYTSGAQTQHRGLLIISMKRFTQDFPYSLQDYRLTDNIQVHDKDYFQNTPDFQKTPSLPLTGPTTLAYFYFVIT